MGDLTTNFSRQEFACHCCGEAEINRDLATALQALRDLAGVSIRVLSGYRCPKHNEEVGGAKESQHMLGNAADIRIGELSVPEMAKLAEQIDAFREGGIGVYPGKGFVHVDVRGKRARWEG